MQMADCKIRNLLRLMKEKNVFKLDQNEGFLLKSGLRSPIYIDLRECFGYADVMKLAYSCFAEMIVKTNENFDGIVGVPYAALPYSTTVAHQLGKPFIIIRKEAKSYGTKKLIEGLYQAGQTVVIIEDVVTTGGSILDVVKIIREEGLIVKDVFCLLDRQQGGAERLKDDGITLHSLFNIELILSFLLGVSAINDEQLQQIITALSLPFKTVPKCDIGMQLETLNTNGKSHSRKIMGNRLPLADRLNKTNNPLNQQIFALMIKKKSNLCLATDFQKTVDVLQLAEAAGPSIIALKIHADIIVDFNQDFTVKLRQIASKHDFLLFEDRKFADIGNVIDLQLKGFHNICDWADMVTCHAVQGSESIISSFKKYVSSDASQIKGILLIAELSAKGSLTTPDYAEKAISVGEENSDVVSGFICQTQASNHPGMLNWTPGVNESKQQDGKGQQWRTIEKAIVEQGNDIIILGRAITENSNPAQELERYQVAAWKALTGESQ
ncbi:unnamed protein product, partial [Mesorhabditis belari]|uniref:Uridine 5'-monophosphate synthase n=1 Tax=Mesorhabditis belari TaxID=2138241 RepID=A0AAF3F3A7_9BILA